MILVLGLVVVVVGLFMFKKSTGFVLVVVVVPVGKNSKKYNYLKYFLPNGLLLVLVFTPTLLSVEKISKPVLVLILLVLFILVGSEDVNGSKIKLL
jgi:hypothetical protein